MPVVETKSARFQYELDGPSSGPTLVFSNSLGTDLRMWERQRDDLKKYFRVLRYNARGQCDVLVPPGPYSIDLLAQDVIELLDALGIQNTSFCGLSMGGMVGMALALNFPDRFHKMVLCNTSPKIGSSDSWNARINAVNKGGMKAVVDAVLERWFTPAFRQKNGPEIQITREMLLNAPATGYVACCAAVRDMDQRDAIAGIRIPTLVVSGASDPVTPPSEGRLIAKKIAGSQYVELPAAHLSNVESADLFNEAVGRFLRE
jgi:3-oxoadipate enol-lactonase